jgi:hypothetical protein
MLREMTSKIARVKSDIKHLDAITGRCICACLEPHSLAAVNPTKNPSERAFPHSLHALRAEEGPNLPRAIIDAKTPVVSSQLLPAGFNSISRTRLPVLSEGHDSGRRIAMIQNCLESVFQAVSRHKEKKKISNVYSLLQQFRSASITRTSNSFKMFTKR